MSKKHYLIVGASWIGDMIMSQSLFRLLKQQDPDCKIDVLAPKSTATFANYMPEVDEVILAPFQRGKLGFKERRDLGKSLRKKAYTHSIVLPNSWKSALVPFFAKIPTRIGFKGEMRYVLLNEVHHLDKSKLPTMIDRFCALATTKLHKLPKDLPWPGLEIPTDEIKKVNRTFNFDHDHYNRLIAFCPGAEYGPAKRWPEKYFTEAAVYLTKKGYDVALMGGPTDQSIAQNIISQYEKETQSNQTDGKLINLVGKTSLSEVVTVLSQVRAVLTNDTGLMHIASAFERPTAVIYGSSTAGFTPPLNKKAESIYLDLDCRPCFKRTCPLGHMNCLNQLTPKIVLDVLENRVV
ncbi:lipopolysaccharide heptosyltransferase II [Thiotrichales bacterium 19S11-10]|nr:lipopolysaccharide heptosyltransferase II [Thiotrichales bacterium 19S11-10]